MRETVFLVRHGHVDGIDRPSFRGRQHLQLTGPGLRQAEQTAAFIHRTARVDAVVSSPLTRCVTTASVIGHAVGLPPIPDEGLIDRDYGDWQGRSLADVQAKDPARAAAWLADPGAEIPNGEPLQALADRVTAAFDRIVSRHAGQAVVVVGHDTVNRVILLRALGLGLEAYGRIGQAPGAVSRLGHDGKNWIVHSMNETAQFAPGPGLGSGLNLGSAR